MRATRPRRLAKALAGAFLTLLAAGLLAPSSAKAGCEHPADRPAIGLDALGLDDGPKSDQLPPPKPCSGPSCSNRSAPPTTSAPQPPPRAELWGVVIETSEVDPPGSSDWTAGDAPARPIRIAPSVFHPPRISR